MKGALQRLRRLRASIMELTDMTDDDTVRDLLMEMELACLDAQDHITAKMAEED